MTISTIGGGQYRTITDVIEIIDLGLEVAQRETQTDSTGTSDTITLVAAPGGSQSRTVTDDMGITEPAFADLSYRETRIDAVGSDDTDPPDRSLGNTILKSATVTDALALTDAVSWSMAAGQVLTATRTDPITLTDVVTTARGTQ